MVNEFSKAYKALGGTIVSVTPYNEKQASYQAEVTAAMAGAAGRALSRQLSGRRRDDRPAWISQGGRRSSCSMTA